MGTEKTYENYPVWVVVLSNLVSLAIYGLGFAIIFRLGLIFSIFYLIYILVLEHRLIGHHCVDCHYWGKACGFGKGRLSSWFFEKGDISRFCAKGMTIKDIIPDILVSLIPLVVGIVLLIADFNIALLFTLLLLIILTMFGNGYVRGKLTCKYCKQKELGCPADRLFNKGERKTAGRHEE